MENCKNPRRRVIHPLPALPLHAIRQKSPAISLVTKSFKLNGLKVFQCVCSVNVYRPIECGANWEDFFPYR